MIRHSGNKWAAPPRFNVAVRIWEKKLKRKVFNNRIVVVILSVYSRAQDGPRNSFGIKRGHIFCFDTFSPLNCGQPCGLSYSAGEAAARVHRAPATALQIATEFATIGSMFSPSQPIRPGVEGKLAALRRLDKSRAWNSLDDQLYCTICKTVISGRQIEVVMACALCILNAPLPVAFPLRLTGSFPLNRTLSARLTFFSATTVSEPPQLARNLACAVARHENSVALWLNQST
jgi:hypothetical protein